MDIGLLAAFLGGALALLSPCGALLLPAFFASTVGSRTQLLVHGTVFYSGLAATLVPMGLGIGAIGHVVTAHRGVVIGITSLLLIGFGIVQILGLGFDVTRILPRRHETTVAPRHGLARTFVLGASGGVAGFCTGPILGAILTLAMSSGSSVTSAVLLSVYGLGMVVPLLALAAAWDRLGAQGRRVLRGRGFVVAGRTLHTTSVVSGTLIAVLGIVFWLTDGLLDAPQIVSTATQSRLQELVGHVTGPAVDIVAVGVGVGVVFAVWAGRERRRTNAIRDAEPEQDRARSTESV